jgi:hypothetical protein
LITSLRAGCVADSGGAAEVDDPGYERAFKEDAPKPSHFNAVSTEWRLAGLGANLCSRVC